MWADYPKWLCVGFDAKGPVIGVIEKQMISLEATAGLPAFRRGVHFVCAARQMIRKDPPVNNQLCAASACNELTGWGESLTAHSVGREAGGKYGLEIPSIPGHFPKHPMSRKAVRREAPERGR
jgi:hypothetical protein